MSPMPPASVPHLLEPDDKDWTWVLDRPCPECGYVAGSVGVETLGARIRDNATAWEGALDTPAASAGRPRPTTWSVLEYACHVRDVHHLMGQRLRRMLHDDEPRFADWDQDATAVEARYDLADPDVVAGELMDAADSVADAYDDVPPGAWGRRGLRGESGAGASEFSVESLGRYHLHDVVHHLHDVSRAEQQTTVASYDAGAGAYRDAGAAMPDSVRSVLDRFLAALKPGARVLEIGSGPGRDASALEQAGHRVRRTDITPAFVELLQADGHAADVLDPLHDDLTDPDPVGDGGPGYDGVWASACLLHVARADLPVVLSRLASVTRPGGVLHLSLKEGDGEAWSTHGSIAAPRHFTYWREEPLCEAIEQAGWRIVEVGHGAGQREDLWLDVLASRAD